MEQIDITGLATAIVIAGALAATGIGLDKLVTPRQKVLLSDYLTEWWLNISDLSFSRIPNFWINAVILTKEKLLGSGYLTYRLVLSITVFSAFATSLFILLGDQLYFHDFSKTIEYFPKHKPLFLYPVTIILDITTVVVTYHAFKLMSKHGSFVRIVVVTLDIAIAIFLGLLTMYITHSLEFWDSVAVLSSDGVNIENLKPATQLYFSYWERLGFINFDWPLMISLTEFTNGWIGRWHNMSDGALGVFLSTCTSVVPTIIYAALILLILASTISLRVVRNISLQVLALDIETEKSIFFYTGTLVGLLVVVGKAILEISKIYA